MSWVFAALPTLNLFFSGAKIPCESTSWQPPGWVFAAAWTFLAITTGGAGSLLYQVNDDQANAMFLVLCFLLGPGWAASASKCSPYILATAVYATLITSILLFIRMQYLQTNAAKHRTEATVSSWLFLPLVVWLCFALFLTFKRFRE
jgi:benzodiazapine receptor